MAGLKVNNLTTEVFQDLSFNLPKTGLLGIVGRNGVGKSTLFSTINGEIKVSDNCIESGKVSYIPNLEIFDKHLSAQDYLRLLKVDEQVVFQKNLETMGGANFLKQKISKYSLGMKELFAILYLLSIQSDLIIFDELLDGLDEQRRFRAYKLLKEQSKTKLILLTSHNLSEVFEVCDCVYLLEKDSLKSIDRRDLERVMFSSGDFRYESKS